MTTLANPVVNDSPSPRLWHAACLLATPWLQLLVNPSLFMTPGGNRYIDPWIYTGFFLSLPEHFQLSPGTYYGARLSWLLPGYLAHTALPPMPANYLLHIGFLYVLLLATYLLVSSAIGRGAALFMTQIVAWSPIVLAAVSWDYVDGAGITYTLCALFFLERSATDAEAHWWWPIAAGVSLVCMVSANFFLITLWPVLGLWTWLRHPRREWRLLAPLAALVVAGSAAAVGVFAFVNVQFGGAWSYLAPQIIASRALLSAPSDYSIAPSIWAWRATWLVLPLVTAVGAIAALLRRRETLVRAGSALQVTLLSAVAIWIVVQAVRTPVLQISYYASYLAPLALLALPMQFGVPLAGVRGRRRIAIEAATVVFLAASHWFAVRHSTQAWQIVSPMFDGAFWINLWGADAFSRQSGMFTFLGLAAGLGLVFGGARIASPAARWLCVAGALAVVGLALPGDLPLAADRLNPGYFQTTVNAHRFIAPYRRDKTLRLWYQEDSPAPGLGVAYTFVWGPYFVNADFPALTEPQAAQLVKGSKLVLLLPRFDDVERARSSLGAFGLSLRVIAHQDFGAEGQALSVVIAEVM